MFIKSKHIYFRALESFDVELLYSIENDTEIWKISNTITPFSKHILEQYLQTAHQDIYTNKQLRLMICMVSTDTPIGTIDLFDFDPINSRVGVGILIFEPFKNNGYGTQAIELLKQYIFNTLMLHQIFCNISSSNIASINLFEKCGFIKIGVKKQWNKIAINTFEDEVLYQLIQ